MVDKLWFRLNIINCSVTNAEQSKWNAYMDNHYLKKFIHNKYLSINKYQGLRGQLKLITIAYVWRQSKQLKENDNNINAFL